MCVSSKPSLRPEFRGGVDIWVPGTPGYEARQADFDALTALGESVWAYVCCGPEGNWLNRFLDFALLKGRLLFWGCAANRLGGFLHWGFNQFPAGMDPFAGTSCPNPYRDRYEFPLWRFFPCLSGNGWSVAGYADGGRQARRRGCSASGAAALQG